MNLETLEESLTYDLTDGTPIYSAEYTVFQNQQYYRLAPPGHLLYAEGFKISDIDLCFAFGVYPDGYYGGGDKEQDYVTVYLRNCSDIPIYVHATISFLGDEQIIQHCLTPGLGWGCPGFVVKNVGQTLTCKFHQLTRDKVAWDTYGEILDLKNKSLMRNVKIDTEEEYKREFFNDFKIQMKKEHGNLNQKLDLLERKVNMKLQHLEKKQDVLDKKLDLLLLLEKNEDAVSLPECPICLEPMIRDTKIAQCLSGHLLCWSCKDKLESKKCPSCNLPVNGRCFGMENYIKTLFDRVTV